MVKTGQYWNVPDMWKGLTAFILGGGPSLKEMDLTGVKHHRVIGVNDAYTFGPWVDINVFGDRKWFAYHWKEWVMRTDGTWHEGLKRFPGLIVGFRDTKPSGAEQIKIMEPNRRGFCREPWRVGWNMNTGSGAINLALHLGARRIVLLGFDMKCIDDQTNWHDNLVRAEKPGWRPKFDLHLKNFEACYYDHQRNWPHVEIFNATPDSALKLWPYRDLSQIISEEPM